MDFDLRTTDSAYSFVQNILGMTSEQFSHHYIIECNSDYEQLWKKQYKQMKHIDSSRIRIWSFHVTGSLDKCSSIRKEGLHNLQHAISTDSIMSRMFRKYGLEFDIENKVMHFEGKEYSVDYDRYRNHCNLYEKDECLSKIAYRLYEDYCVNGFMCNDDFRSYGFDVCIRPEFILDLVNMFPQLSKLDLEWRRNSESYKINFFTYINQLERYTLELDEYRDPPYVVWNNLEDNDKALKWMLGHAIARSFDELSDTYLYVKSDLCVPPEQIYNCEKI